MRPSFGAQFTGPWRDRRGRTRNRRLGPLVQHPPPHLALGGITPQQEENQHTTTRKEAASTSLHKTQDLAPPTMRPEPAVGVDHELPARQPGIGSRPALNELTRRIHKNFGVLVYG